MSIGKNIRLLRDKYNISQVELAEIAGVTDKAVSTWENNINEPRMGAIQKIADHFGLRKSNLIEEGGMENKPFSHETIDVFSIPGILPITKIKIPLLKEINCGVPSFAEKTFESYVEVGSNINADYAIRARGDSMAGAFIRDGDIVFVRKQDIVQQGEIALVVIDDNATLKRFYQYDELVLLRAANPDFEDIVINLQDGQGVHILGKVVAFQSNVK